VSLAPASRSRSSEDDNFVDIGLFHKRLGEYAKTSNSEAPATHATYMRLPDI